MYYRNELLNNSVKTADNKIIMLSNSQLELLKLYSTNKKHFD